MLSEKAQPSCTFYIRSQALVYCKWKQEDGMLVVTKMPHYDSFETEQSWTFNCVVIGGRRGRASRGVLKQDPGH